MSMDSSVAMWWREYCMVIPLVRSKKSSAIPLKQGHADDLGQSIQRDQSGREPVPGKHRPRDLMIGAENRKEARAANAWVNLPHYYRPLFKKRVMPRTWISRVAPAIRVITYGNRSFSSLFSIYRMAITIR
jgi:hypothetical protein